MELTKLEQFYKTAMEELSNVNGRTYVLNSFVTQSKERIDTDPRVGHDLITSGLPFRDVTLAKGSDNLHMSTNFYNLSRANLKEEVDMILSRECLFQISQAYEILESFLYNMVAEFINTKTTFGVFIDPKSNSSTFSSTRKALKTLSDRKNNKHLLGIIRSNSSVFREHEKENIYDLDFQKWYDMISEVRHCITHSRMQVTKEFSSSLPSCFTDYFEVKSYNNEDTLFLDYQHCSELLTRISDYMFLIFKAITEDCTSQPVNFASIQHIIPDPHNATS